MGRGVLISFSKVLQKQYENDQANDDYFNVVICPCLVRKHAWRAEARTPNLGRDPRALGEDSAVEIWSAYGLKPGLRT